MFSAIDEWGQAFLIGIGLGLVITFVVGAVGLLLMHFCIVPWGVWCAW